MQTNDAGAVGQAAALNSVVPELERLEKLLAEENDNQVKTLESFASEAGLQRLEELAEQQRSEFDALDFIGRLRLGSGSNLWSDEEFHSNLLAWILDPRESHGIGRSFLTNFLRETCAQSRVQDADWTHANIIREWPNEVDGVWGYLDILILNESEQILCAIENKVFSSEHSEQLTRYRKALADSYPDFTRHHVFLTPRGTLAYREEERKHWTPASYAVVLDILLQMVSDNGNPVKEDTRSFLRQYATTLRRNIVPETSIAQLARKIYLEHREAIDLTVQYKPDYRNEMKGILKEAISTYTDWRLYADDASFVYFQPLDFTQYQGMQPSESHARYSLVGCEFQCPQQGNAWFCVEIAPETESNKFVRGTIVEAINQHPGVFNSAGQVATGWMTVHRGDSILDEGDLSKWDDPSTRAKIEAWVKNFAENRFPAMNEVIVNCLREYEAETQNQ